MVGVRESVLHHGVGGCIITPKGDHPGLPAEKVNIRRASEVGLPLEVSAYQVCQEHRPYSSRGMCFARLIRSQGGVGARGDEIARGWRWKLGTVSRLNGSCPGGYRGTKPFGARVTWNLHP